MLILPHPRQRHRSKLGWLAPDGTLRQRRAPLPFPYCCFDAARSHAVADGWVVGLRPGPLVGIPGPAALCRARLTWVRGRPRLVPLPDIAVSVWQETRALLVVGNWLYVGGGAARDYCWPRTDGERHDPAEPRPVPAEYLVRYDLTAPHPSPEPVPLPVAFGPGKAIDDLLRLGDELLVVDNIVFPKYLFFYHLRPSPALPVWQKTHELPFARVYEDIQGSEWNADFVALLSSSTGGGGSTYYVSVLRRPDLRPVLLLATHWDVRHRVSAQAAAAQWMIEGLALQGVVLLVACGVRGIAQVQLQTRELWPKQRVSVTYCEKFPPPTQGPAEWKRRRETVLRPALDLAAAGPAEGVTWLPLPAGCRTATRVRFAGPGLALLTGIGTDGRAGAWLLPVAGA